ncbi:MAG: circularly permuted type 2 ATP-grasp protein [Hyphomicrobiales bacterium]|nr:circularly permuted type 2 ATP-grasp protein [Hyphomicrobiales bacterium]
MRWSDAVDPALSDLVAGYRPVPGVHDELVDAEGRPRAHWLPLLARLAALGRPEVARRFAGADRYLSESGVVYRVYEDGRDFDRPWPIAHLPIVIDELDWQVLAEGVEQRARLFEALLADLMGRADLVASGALPAALVAGNPEYLRPLSGVAPADGHFLHLYAADVTRAPDGRWWVLADRTQAPSGAGYAIENRVALSRALPEAFEDLGVERLGPFFQSLRAGLAHAAGAAPEPRIALLTPGSGNETYFEHAFLARCLGFQLVEGGDLVASETGVAVRTVAGLERIDVLVRRIDADFADPLELNPNSRLGVPGLVEAVRAGRVAVANALGSGLVEAPGLTGFLPNLCRRLLGEDLALPNVATWWCGEPAARETVLRDLDRLTLAPAFGRTLPGILDSAGVLGARLTRAERERYAGKLARRGVDFVGREPLRLSTAPVWEKGRLTPRPFAIRVFVARTPDGWRVMPGGLARFAEREDVRLLSMQRGGRSGDVWVLGAASAAARAETRLLPEPDKAEIRRDNGILPARAADNLFWFGRYLERAETTLRLLRGLDGHGDDGVLETSRDLTRRIAGMLRQGGAVDEEAVDALGLAEAAAWGPTAGSAARLVAEAHRTGSVVRDRLSPDAWRTLAELRDRLARAREDGARPLPVFDEIESALRAIAAVVGLAQETMNRRDGWHFFDLGRRIERAIGLTRSARAFTEADADADALDMLLDLADGRVTYRTRYLSGSARRPVLDLVLLDEANPRALAFQVARVVEHLATIAARREGDLIEPAERLARRLATGLETDDAALFDAERLRAVEAELRAISDAVTVRYFASGSPLPTDDAGR